MRTNAAITGRAFAGLAALACAGSVQAHHTHLVYQTTPIWISGTVTRFELKNPHAITTLEGRTENGQAQVWTVEGPSQSELERRGGSGEYSPKIGDMLEVCAYPYRSAEEVASDSRLPSGSRLTPAQMESTPEGASPRLLLGHMLLTTGGAMRVWEPFGRIGDCMRASNVQRQSWLELLNANPEAHKFWCDERATAAAQSSSSSKDFIEEINTLLADPCK